MLAAVSSRFSVPISAGAGGAYTSPHRLQRSCSNSYTVACTGACPTIRTRTAGTFNGYTFPFTHSGHRSPGFISGCVTFTLRAPSYDRAGFRPCPLRFCFSAAGLAASLASGWMPARSSTARVFSVVAGFNSILRSCRSVASLSASIRAICPNVSTAALNCRRSWSVRVCWPVRSTSFSNSSILTSMVSGSSFMTYSIGSTTAGSAGAMATPAPA